MRTTVTLDQDVEQYIREACHKRKKSFKRVINDALRESLQPKTSRPELLAPRSMGLMAPGVDPRRLSDLADDLEAEAYLAAESKRSYKNKAQK